MMPVPKIEGKDDLTVWFEQPLDRIWKNSFGSQDSAVL